MTMPAPVSPRAYGRVTPHYEEWDGQGSLVAFVISKNLHRRQLTPAQRAAVGVDMLPLMEEEGLARMAHGGMRALEARGVIAPPDEAVEREEEDGMAEGAMPGRVNLPYLAKSATGTSGGGVGGNRAPLFIFPVVIGRGLCLNTIGRRLRRGRSA